MVVPRNNFTQTIVFLSSFDKSVFAGFLQDGCKAMCRWKVRSNYFLHFEEHDDFEMIYQYAHL